VEKDSEIDMSSNHPAFSVSKELSRETRRKKEEKKNQLTRK